MPWGNPIIGGQGVLIRDNIRSSNYVTGVSGWAIFRDGTAEFNNVTVRGSLLVTGQDGAQLEVEPRTINGRIQPVITILPPDPDGLGTYEPAEIHADEVIGNPDHILELELSSPEYVSGAGRSVIHLYGEGTDAVNDPARVVVSPSLIVTASPPNGVGDFYADSDIGTGGDVNVAGDVRNTGSGLAYAPVQFFDGTIAFGAAAVAVALGNTNFPIALPTGSFAAGRIYGFVNITSSAGGAPTQWHGRFLPVSDTQYNLVFYRAAAPGAASSLSYQVGVFLAP